MFRTFRYPLQPTKAQEAVLTSWLSACCALYNGALQHRRDAWRKQCVSISYYNQQKELTGLRAADPEWAAVPMMVERSALTRVDRAFVAFYKRCKAGQTPGFPRFRSSARYSSFDLGSNLPRIDGDRVFLPKLGAVRFRKYRELKGELRHVAVRRSTCGKWSISFVCELSEVSRVPVRQDRVIGIDLGLSVFAKLSNGESVENPRFSRSSEEPIAFQQRTLARKKRGSNSRREAKRLVARAHEHVRNQRLDFARKLACMLYKRFDFVAYEDLEIARMKRGTFAKSISDAGWGIAINALILKAESAGKWAVAIDPRRTSIECSGCGESVPKDLSQREHRCPKCGLVLDRDENAARNILARGLRAGQLTEALDPRAAPKLTPKVVFLDG